MESRMSPCAVNDPAPRHKNGQSVTTAMTMTVAQIVDADIKGISTPAKAQTVSGITNNDTMLSVQSSSYTGGRASASGSIASSGSASGSASNSASYSSVKSSVSSCRSSSYGSVNMVMTNGGTGSRPMMTATTRESLSDDCELLERYSNLNMELDEMVVKSHRSSLCKRNSFSALASLSDSASLRCNSTSNSGQSVVGLSLSPGPPHPPLPVPPAPEDVEQSDLTTSGGLSPRQLTEMAVLNEARNIELTRLRANSCQMIQCQKDLLDKMEKHERNVNSYRRFFYALMNQQQRLDKLKHKLEQQLQASVEVDTRLEQLEQEAEPFVAKGKYAACCVASSSSSSRMRRSFSLVQPHHARPRHPMRPDQRGLARPASLSSLALPVRGSSSSGDSLLGSLLDNGQTKHQNHSSACTAATSNGTATTSNGLQPRSDETVESTDEKVLDVKIEQLEHERESVLNGLFRSGLGTPDLHQLHTRVAMVGSEIKATQSIYQQVRKCCSLYRQALQRVRTALAAIVSSEYSGSLREFLKTIYPLCIEAGQLVEGAGMVFQPESKRRYGKYASAFVKVQMPRFPGIINDCARRGRTHFDPNSSLMLEGARKLKAAENNVRTLQKMVLDKMDRLETWRQQVELDVVELQDLHRSLETKLRVQVDQCAQRIRKSLDAPATDMKREMEIQVDTRFRRATSTPDPRVTNNPHSHSSRTTNNHAVVMAS